MNGRDASLDIAKTVAMFAIVFLHVRTNAPLADFGLVVGLDNFLDVFVLSLFVLVSGYLSRGLILSGDGSKLVRRVVACLWPILTMMVLLGQVIDLCVRGHFQPPTMGWPRYALSVGWFFFCLAFCMALTFAAHAVSRGRKGCLVLLLVTMFVVLWALPVGMCHTKDMIGYFWFGVYAYPAYARLVCRRTIGFVAAAASLALCLLLPDFREIGLWAHGAPMPPGTFSLPGCGLAVAKYALGLSAALGVLELARTVAQWIGKPSAFAAISAQTMGIFFIHIQLLGVFYATVNQPVGGFAGRFYLAGVLFVVSYWLVLLTQANAVIAALLWNPLELGRLKREKGKGGA